MVVYAWWWRGTDAALLLHARATSDCVSRSAGDGRAMKVTPASGRFERTGSRAPSNVPMDDGIPLLLFLDCCVK